jgi:hypothetical protein
MHDNNIFSEQTSALPKSKAALKRPFCFGKLNRAA